MNRLTIRFVIAVGVLSMLLVACGSTPGVVPTGQPTDLPASSSATSPPPTSGLSRSELVARIPGDIKTMDPCRASTNVDDMVAANVFSTLVQVVPGGMGELEPGLATSWDVSPDGLTWTFHLRDGVEFHKGYGPVDADAVKYSFERLMGNKECSNASYLSSVDHVEAVDDHTVMLALKEPYAPLLAVLAYRAGWIVPQKAIEELGDDFGLSPVGSGPYVFTSWTPNTEIVLTANEDYYGGAPAIKKVVLKEIVDETVAGLALESGELDLAWIRSSELYEKFRAEPDRYTVDASPGVSMRWLAMNTKQKPFDDVRVRQAVAYAINRDDLLNVVLAGTLGPNDSVLSPVTYGYFGDVKHYEYDPEKAKQLLADAGYPDGFDITLICTQLAPWPDIVPVLKENLDAVGINTTLECMEHGAFTAFIQTGEALMTVRPGGRADADMVLTLEYHSSNFPPGHNNVSFYDGADDLIDAARKEVDDATRKATYAEIQRKMAEDVPVVPIGYQMIVAVMQPYVQGYRAGVTNEYWLHTLYFAGD